MTEAEVLEWLTDVFNEDPGNIAIDTPRDAIPEWDSLGVLNLMADMDEKFNISLSEEDLEQIDGIGDIFRILRENGVLGEHSSNDQEEDASRFGEIA